MERFWSKVEKTDGCWLWTGSRSTGGYGYFYLNGRNSPAHRVAYEMLVGPIPAGLQIDHLCRVRNCVNPAHLEPVTQRENLLRGETVTARSASRTHCPQGHPYDAENTSVRKTGKRDCRTCHREQGRRYWRERKATP